MEIDKFTILDVDRVNVVRNARYLLAGVNLRVGAGEHWALIGPNGAGKSTLLSLLGALVHPTSGSVHVLGHRLGRVDMRQLRTLIGHVDPRHRLDQPLPAVEVVLTGLTNTALPVARHEATADQRMRAHELLTQLGMGSKHHTTWTTMSQGERGRVLIARALLSEPKLLLLDEPTTGLDLAAREQLLDAVGDLAASEPALATVMVTHHLEELPPNTTHVLMLREGRVLAAGPITETLTSTHVSDCFGYSISVRRRDGRWTAQSSRRVSTVPERS